MTCFLAIGLLAAPTAVQAIILHPDDEAFLDQLLTPHDAVVGQWGGGSAVAIAPNFFLATQHQGGGGTATFGGVTYNVAEVFRHDEADLSVVQIAPGQTFEHYTPVNTGLRGPAQVVTLGGYGEGRGDTYVSPAPNHYPMAYEWDGQAGTLRWGQNKIIATDEIALGGYVTQSLIARFDHPEFFSDVVPFEATVANGDSGGGWFVYEEDEDQWYVAGLTLSVEYPDFAIFLGPFPNLDVAPEHLFAADLAHYTDFIHMTIPEPATALLVATGMLAGFLSRSRPSAPSRGRSSRTASVVRGP